MTGELDATGLDAVMRARLVTRNAELMEQARGKRRWTYFASFACLVAVASLYLRWVKPTTEVLVGLMLLGGVVGWADRLLSRRLDAIVRLLEQFAENE